MKANVLYLAAMMVTLMQYACMRDGATSSNVYADADHEAEVVADCFTRLIAGPTDQNGKLSKVFFGHGSCQGQSVALHTLTEHDAVEIVIDGASYETSLYKEGQDVMADIGGQIKKVATFGENPDDAALTLASDTKLALAVIDNGSQRTWQKNEPVDGKTLRLRLTVQ